MRLPPPRHLGTQAQNRRMATNLVPRPGSDDNGILTSVPGQYIGAAVSQCPDARTAQSDTHQVEIDAGYVGRVVITCKRVRERRFGRWFWSAVRADPIA